MRRLRRRWVVLAGVAGLYGTLVVSDFGVLYWLTDTTRSPAPGTPEERYGVIPTFRCRYFTGAGTFSVETSMAFGAETCSLFKHRSRAA